MLPLAEVEERHHGCFLILWGIPLEDFLDEAVVLFGELERNRGIVVLGVTMLKLQLGLVRHR